MKQLLLILAILCFYVHDTWTQITRSMTPTITSNERLALVIGNSAYKGKPLPNAHNDAVDMAAQLRTLEFEVILKENLNKEDMENAIADFTHKLKNYGVGLFYFAGHGFMSTQKENYLKSVEMRENLTEAFAKEKSISMETLMASMDEAKSPTKLLFLDACSNNPFRSWGRSDQKGLGSVAPPEGMVAFFAASPGQEASENPGKRNGLFTQELLQQLRKPNLELTELIRNTRNQVKLYVTAQSPYRVGDLSDVFYFKKGELKEVVENKTVKEVVENETITKKYLDLLPFAEMAYIPGGSFEMGSNEGEADEKPAHTVTLDGFYMGKYEVTVEQFATFIKATNYQTDAEKGDGSYIFTGGRWEEKAGIDWRYDAEGNIRSKTDYGHPVIHVSWNDAKAFTDWLSERENKIYRLPTEAEWEYAAGSGTKHTTYSWGNGEATAGSGNITGTSDGYENTAPVGKFAPNGFGLYNMSGNVLEWCSDWYGSYSSDSQSNPRGAKTGAFRGLRGGSWDDNPSRSRVAYRSGNGPSTRGGDIGFRVLSPQ